MQQVSLQTISTFMQYFNGSDAAHGVHVYGEQKTTEGSKVGKREGKSWTEDGLPTEKHFSDHLTGKKGLGLIPIYDTNKVDFCVMDVDIYSEKVDHFVHMIYLNQMPLVPFRSKSGGLHLYLFFSETLTAAYAVSVMERFLLLLGLSKETELFPKQKTLKPGEKGNWINLPYYNKGKPIFDALQNGLEDSNGEIMPLEQALIEIEAKKQTKKTLDEYLDNLPLNDAPPCLQAIYLTGDTTHRNNYLFNMSCYFKSKYGDDFESHLTDANNLLVDPIPLAELNATVNRNKGKEYHYTCSQEPICSRCSKKICSKREFGINSDMVSNLNFEDFLQYKTDPPYYEWKVNGKWLKFYKEIDIIRQDKFRELCVREIHKLPSKLKDFTWSRIVNDALENVVVKEVSPEDDISPGALFRLYLVEFLEKRAQAKTKEQILIDRVYKDEEYKRYIFKGKDLQNFLVHIKSFRHYGSTEVQAKLREMGGEPTRFYMGKVRGNTRVWSLPFNGIDIYVDAPDISSFEIDFHDEYEEAEY